MKFNLSSLIRQVWVVHNLITHPHDKVPWNEIRRKNRIILLKTVKRIAEFFDMRENVSVVSFTNMISDKEVLREFLVCFVKELEKRNIFEVEPIRMSDDDDYDEKEIQVLDGLLNRLRL